MHTAMGVSRDGLGWCLILTQLQLQRPELAASVDSGHWQGLGGGKETGFAVAVLAIDFFSG